MSMMAHDLGRMLDPVALARDTGIEPDQWQQDLLRNVSKRVLMLCSRQSGKSEVAVQKAIWSVLFDPGLVVLVSPSQRQSSEIFKRLVGRYAELKNVPEMVSESALRCELANGSRIVALPGSERTTRGYAAVKMVIVDEAARVEDSLLQAIRPMLATTAGSLIALSTPAGRRGWFFEAWHDTNVDWHRVRVSASECPRIGQEFLDEELKALGPARFSEEYELEFRDSDEAVFPGTVIEAAFTTQVTPLWT